MQVFDKDREKVVAEISDCQSRILQTLVPTIISVGLISIADRENIALITLFSAFAVLFASSLYVGSLTYKIFRNAAFIRALTDLNQSDSHICWEKALSVFVKSEAPPKIVGSETRAISIIYLVFSFAFIFMFYGINPLMSALLGVILIFVALRIYILPSSSEKYYESWKRILTQFDSNENNVKQ